MYKPKTSDEAVEKATGKKWGAWFSILDRAGAKRMAHIDIARHVYDGYLGKKNTKLAPDVAKKGGWWSQMVTVEYERSRGLRQINQTSTGFNVSVHGTFDVPVSKLFTAWQKVAKKNGLVESTVHKNKIIRYKSEKGNPMHVAAFTPKGPRKSRIGFEVMRLPKPSEVEKQRTKWKKEIAKLI
jgi:hypothetical protein